MSLHFGTGGCKPPGKSEFSTPDGRPMKPTAEAGQDHEPLEKGMLLTKAGCPKADCSRANSHDLKKAGLTTPDDREAETTCRNGAGAEYPGLCFLYGRHAFSNAGKTLLPETHPPRQSSQSCFKLRGSTEDK